MNEHPAGGKKRRLHLRSILKTGLLLALLALLLSPAGKAAVHRLYTASGYSGTWKSGLTIAVLDVGKADAIVIQCDGELAVLDGGTPIHGDTVADYLAYHQLGVPKFIFVSHPDSDHEGGIPQLLEEVGCTGCVYRSPGFSQAYAPVEEATRQAGIPVTVLSAGDSLELGSAQIRVLGPDRQFGEANNGSLVLMLEKGDFRALFCGDIEKQAEEALLESGQDLSANLLKVPHHGSKTSSTTEFLQAVSPDVGVISVGRDRNELPRQEVLLRLEEYCGKIYRTDVDETVLFCYDGGQNFSIRTKDGEGETRIETIDH